MMSEPSKKINIGDMETKKLLHFLTFMSSFSCVSLSGHLCVCLMIFVTVVNFKQTEGPFMHSPTL